MMETLQLPLFNKAQACMCNERDKWITHFFIILTSEVAQSCPTLCDPMDCSPPASSVHGDSPGKNTGVGCHALLQGIFSTQGSNPGIEPRSLTLQVDSLPSKPPEKPKSTVTED